MGSRSAEFTDQQNGAIPAIFYEMTPERNAPKLIRTSKTMVHTFIAWGEGTKPPERKKQPTQNFDFYVIMLLL